MINVYESYKPNPRFDLSIHVIIGPNELKFSRSSIEKLVFAPRDKKKRGRRKIPLPGRAKSWFEFAMLKKEESGDGETRIGISENVIYTEGAQQGGGGERRKRGSRKRSDNLLSHYSPGGHLNGQTYIYIYIYDLSLVCLSFSHSWYYLAPWRGEGEREAPREAVENAASGPSNA